MATADVTIQVKEIDIKQRRYKVTDTYEVSGEGSRSEFETAIGQVIQTAMAGEIDEMEQAPVLEKVTVNWKGAASPQEVSIIYEFHGNYRGSPLAPLVWALIVIVGIAVTGYALHQLGFIFTPLERIVEELGALPFILGGAALLILAIVLLTGKKKAGK